MNRLFNRSKNEPAYSVLVLEDDVPINHLIVELLKDQGYTAHSAYSAEQAFTLLEEIPLPNLFIVDYMLSDINGQQFVERMRVRLGRSKMPPVLLLTASTEGEATANRVQVEDYLPKPFNNHDLMEHVGKLLSRT